MVTISKRKIRLFLVALAIASISLFYLFTTLQASGAETSSDTRYMGVAAFIFVLLLFYFRHVSLPSRLLPLVIFVVYGAGNLLVHQEWLQSIMWAIWLLYVALLFPAIFSRNADHFFVFLNWLLWLLLISMLILVAYSYNAGLDLAWQGARHRFTGGTANPSILGKAAGTIFWLSFLLYVYKTKIIYLIASGFAIILLFYIDMRSDLYGVIFGIFIYVFLTLRSRAQYLIAWSAGLGVAALTLSVDWSLELLDSFLSRRISFWIAVTNESDPLGSVWRFLFGTGSHVLHDHYDNQWLEIALRFGLIGFLLFVYVWVKMFAYYQAQRTRESNRQLRNMYAWAMAASGSLALMGLTSYIMPSLGNVYNLVLIPVLVSIYYSLAGRLGAYNTRTSPFTPSGYPLTSQKDHIC